MRYRRLMLATLFVLLMSTLSTGIAYGAENAIWQASYWNNVTLSGPPDVTRVESSISHDFGLGRPATGVSEDYFSARWSRAAYFPAGRYEFIAVSDDGVRVWIDNTLIIDDWGPHQVHAKNIQRTISEGTHRITVEYYELTGGAIVDVWWQPAPAEEQWLAEYYNDIQLASSPVMVRHDPAITFDWGARSPGFGVNVNRFAVRWTREVTFDRGWYQFEMVVDDGVRLWVDGDLVIDEWVSHDSARFIAEVFVTGPTELVMEYYEETGDAVANLQWRRAFTPPEPNALVLDAGGSNFVQGGPWEDWETHDRGYGDSSLMTLNSDDEERDYNWGRWYPGLRRGTYEVRVYVPAFSGLTTHARYWVRTSRGYHRVIIDQSAHQGQWVSLGIYPFAGVDGTVREFVSVSDVTTVEANRTSYVVFDAVQFIPR